MFQGSCHCGKVAFTVDADAPEQAIACNCSHCRRKGFLLAFFPPETFTLASGQDDLESYFFNRHAIEHRFCGSCGVEPFASGKGPDGKAMIAINLRCVDTIDPDALTLMPYDGAAA